MRRRGTRIKRTRGGDFRLNLPDVERQILRSLRQELRALLDTDDPALGRLFPPPYPGEPERNAEYASLVHDELLGKRLNALEVMESTIDADHLDEDQLTSWLTAVNDARLVLGTRLDVTEETYEQEIPDDHPNAARYAVYAYLGWLEEQIVEVLAEGVEGSGSG